MQDEIIDTGYAYSVVVKKPLYIVVRHTPGGWDTDLTDSPSEPITVIKTVVGPEKGGLFATKDAAINAAHEAAIKFIQEMRSEQSRLLLE